MFACMKCSRIPRSREHFMHMNSPPKDRGVKMGVISLKMVRFSIRNHCWKALKGYNPKIFRARELPMAQIREVSMSRTFHVLQYSYHNFLNIVILLSILLWYTNRSLMFWVYWEQNLRQTDICNNWDELMISDSWFWLQLLHVIDWQFLETHHAVSHHFHQATKFVVGIVWAHLKVTIN